MIKEKLINDKKLLEKQLFWIDISYDECSKIGIKDKYSIDEFGRFETLCSRYSRGIDFLIRKIFRMKDVRNTIVHEYIEDELVEVFDEVLEYTECLIKIINNTLRYIDEK